MIPMAMTDNDGSELPAKLDNGINLRIVSHQVHSVVPNLRVSGSVITNDGGERGHLLHSSRSSGKQ
jgi:hypothetical protein